jgi:hypothetical protein
MYLVPEEDVCAWFLQRSYATGSCRNATYLIPAEDLRSWFLQKSLIRNFVYL